MKKQLNSIERIYSDPKVTFSVKMRAFGVAIFIPGGEQALLMELF